MCCGILLSASYIVYFSIIISMMSTIIMLPGVQKSGISAQITHAQKTLHFLDSLDDKQVL